MQNKLKTLCLLITIIAGFSCEDRSLESPPPAIDQKAIESFIAFVDLGVETLASNPPKDPYEATDILMGKIRDLETHVGIDLQINDSRGSSMGREPVAGGAPQASSTKTQLVKKVVRYSQVSTSARDYLRKLAMLRAEIITSRLGRAERSELLTLVGLNEEFVRYLDRKVLEATRSGNQVAPAMKCTGWWSCWGKCVAGTVGGAGLGALAGASYGGIGCTMVLPVVGTVACGTVGAVAGGIFGGLAGAAAAC